MKFILKASVWDSDADNESIMEDKSHYTEDGNCWTVKPQQFRKLKEIKIQVLYLIVNVIHFQQGKDFLPSFFFFSYPSSCLALSCISLCLWLCPFVSLQDLLSLFPCLCLSICLFVSVPASLSPPHCLPCISLSLSLEFYKEGLPKSSIWAFLWHGGKRLADTLQSMTLRSYLFSW